MKRSQSGLVGSDQRGFPFPNDRLGHTVGKACWLVGWLVAQRVRDGSAQTTVRAATMNEKLQIKHAASASYSILTLGGTVLALAIMHHDFQHFSSAVNSAELPPLYQVLWSASVCQLSHLPCIKYCGLPVSVS